MNTSFSIESIAQPESLKQVALSLVANQTVIRSKKTASTSGKSNFIGFKQKGDLIFILGESSDDLSFSVYLNEYHNIASSGDPKIDDQKQVLLEEAIKGLIDNEYINAAHACSVGGLFISLIEMALPLELGFDIVTDSEVREDAFLFGETPSRAVVTVSEDQEDDFIEFMITSKLPFTLLGHVTKGKIMVDDEHFGFVQEYQTLVK